jgi:two-component system alkaline phosphatase synthesis response regulator PhoP
MDGARPKILVVEDEEHLAEGISLNLDAEGYEPVLAGDGVAAVERLKRGGIDLVILDVMLPRLSGLDVCAEARRAGVRVPILFLTAKGRPEDRVRGLELGGDDYLAKPFHLKELLSRVRALLRRQSWSRDAAVAAPSGASRAGARVRFGGNEVDFATGDFTARDGAKDRMTEKEAAILRVLVEAAGEPVSRADIVDRAWGPSSPDDAPTARTIDNFVVRLRRRFEEDPARPRHILTAFGVGYRFVS